MIEAYQLPLRLKCNGCNGEGKQKPHPYYEAYPDVFEVLCDECAGLGYTIEHVQEK